MSSDILAIILPLSSVLTEVSATMPLRPISCPNPLEKSCSRRGRINTEVSYLYLYLIWPHPAKITILSYLWDKREFIFYILSKILFQIIFPNAANPREQVPLGILVTHMDLYEQGNISIFPHQANPRCNKWCSLSGRPTYLILYFSILFNENLTAKRA